MKDTAERVKTKINRKKFFFDNRQSFDNFGYRPEFSGQIFALNA